MRAMKRISGALLLAATLATAAGGQTIGSVWTVSNVLARIPPLQHERAGRWPMITWEPFQTDSNDTSYVRGQPLDAGLYRELLRRGLTQAIRMNARYIPTARALQEAGAPVILMEGKGGNGPAGEAPDTLHHLPKDYVIPKGAVLYPCPMVTAGWEKRAGLIRQTLEQFKAAGVTVDAVWLDWEVEPLTWSLERWQQARQCPRCRATLPSGVLRNPLTYADFIKPLRQRLCSDYLAAPILAVYPKASVSNWDARFSSAGRPAYNWWGDTFPPMDIGRFTASMPAVYGSNAIFTDYWYGRVGAPWSHWR